MSDSSLPIGTVLLGYKIDSVLGRGGFGITYLAEDILSEDKVVIKEFFPKDLVSREFNSNKSDAEWTNPVIINTNIEDDYNHFLKKFILEIEILMSIKHKNIVEILKYFEKNYTVYFVMPHIEGSTLHQYIKENQLLNETFIIQTINSLLDGLEEVHKNGIIHRDIAPNNIYITKDLKPLLLDFGAAKNLDINNPNSIPVYKHGYSAPEQYIWDSSKHTKATDIYAIGATILTMMSGGVPPPSSSVREQKKEINVLKDFINKYQNGYSDKLIEIVEKSMKIKQEDRFQSVGELKNELSTIKINISTNPTDIIPQHKISFDSEKPEINPKKKLNEEKLEEYKDTCDYKLTDEDIENAEGNYIFTIGLPSSGKTSLQTAMLYRLYKYNNIKFKYFTNTIEHEIIIREWLNEFNNNKIPSRTHKGDIQRFTISFGFKKNKSEKNFLKINFLEISGEDIKTIQATPENKTPKLHPHLEALLKSETIKKYFLFVFDVNQTKDIFQGTLFDKFLDYLKEIQPNLKEIDCLFIFSKSDYDGDIRKKYKTAKEYANKHLPNALGVNMEYFFFSLGEFDKNDTKGLTIKNFNPKDIDMLIYWIYSKISGKKLKIENRLFSFFKEILSYLKKML